MKYDKEVVRRAVDKGSYYGSELGDLKTIAAGRVMSLCPFHADKNPSLSVNLETGEFNCFGCGVKGDLFKFREQMHGETFQQSLEWFAKYAGVSQAEPEKKSKRIAATYDYKDEAGKLLFQAVRYEPKTFTQRQPDGKGSFVYNLHGVQLVPYNLQAVRQAGTIYIVEGEKDADNLNAQGFTATTNAMGAGKWKAEYNEHFKDKDIVILPDNDEPGEKHAQAVARSLNGTAKSIKIVPLPDLPHKGDVSDWFKAGGTKEQLLKFAEDAQAWTPQTETECKENRLDPLSFLQTGTQLQALDIKIEWAIDRLIPKQSITLLHGRGGIGKTWLSLILSQALDAISENHFFMGQAATPMPVVYVDFENPLPSLCDRIRMIGIKNVFFWHSANTVIAPPKLDSQSWELYKILPPGSLLIFDTLRASQAGDENSSKEMAVVMARLKELRDMGFTIVLLHHTPKGNDRTYKGSTAILDLADHVLSLHRVKKNNIDEIIDDEETDECFYRFGTKDKTRYEPFHLFMVFDKEKGFRKALDPDTEDMEAIREILAKRGSMNQTQLFDLARSVLEIASKGKFTSLMVKGDGKFWKTIKESRARFYEALPIVQLSTPYIPNSGQIGGTVQFTETVTPIDPHKTLDMSGLSYCPGGTGTGRTDEVLDLTGSIDVI